MNIATKVSLPYSAKTTLFFFRNGQKYTDLFRMLYRWRSHKNIWKNQKYGFQYGSGSLIDLEMRNSDDVIKNSLCSDIWHFSMINKWLSLTIWVNLESRGTQNKCVKSMELLNVFKVLNFQRTYCVKNGIFYHEEPHHKRILGVC